MAVKVTAADYLAQLQALLPQGPAWPREADALLTKLLKSSAAEFARVHNRCFDLIREVNPLFSLEMLPDWERTCGLPDACYLASNDLPIQDRRTAVINKLNAKGGQSLGYFKGLAESFGYPIEVAEFRPFRFGFSRFGETQLMGGPETIFNWKISVLEARSTPFRFGSSRLGRDKLLRISRAEDLECLIQKYAPAHTNIIFSYEGI